jgi:hypothetical protein
MIVFKEEITNHFIHAFTSIPMEKGLSTEHSCKLFRDTFEEFLNGCAVTCKKKQNHYFLVLYHYEILPMKVADILRPRGGISQTAVLTLFGIHSTKYEEFLF